MKWIKWTIHTLPPVKEKVLIVYKSGYMGTIEFFHDQEDKEIYISGMIWIEKNPNADMGGIIGNCLKEMSDSDPIIAWMKLPEPPKY